MILALGAGRGVLSEVLSLWSVWDRRANTVSDNQLGCRSPGACLHVMSTPLASMAQVLWEGRQDKNRATRGLCRQTGKGSATFQGCFAHSE